MRIIPLRNALLPDTIDYFIKLNYQSGEDFIPLEELHFQVRGDFEEVLDRNLMTICDGKLKETIIQHLRSAAAQSAQPKATA